MSASTTVRPESLPSGPTSPAGSRQRDATTSSLPANLQQRILAITAEVAVKATGKTAQGQRTMSISDVEESLADLCAKHGVVIGDYTYNGEPKIVGQQGNSTIWLADLTLYTINADEPTERMERRVIDVGTSPSAAVSFALKRSYRALFHLADEEDEKRSTPATRKSEVVPSRETPKTVGAERQGGRDNPAVPNLSIHLSDNEKHILAHLADTLNEPWSPQRRVFELGRLGSFLLVRDLLLGLHRDQHKDCTHFAEAVATREPAA